MGASGVGALGGALALVVAARACAGLGRWVARVGRRRSASR